MSRWIILAMMMLSLMNCAEVPVKPILVNIPPKYMIEKVPLFRQGMNECGPTTLSMVLHYHGHHIVKDDLKIPLQWNPLKGVDVLHMTGFQFSKYGLKAKPVWSGSIALIEENIAQGYLVMIRHWSTKTSAYHGDIGHWDLVIGYDRDKKIISLNDPRLTKVRKLRYEEFMHLWDMNHHKSPSKNFMIIIMKE